MGRLITLFMLFSLLVGTCACERELELGFPPIGTSIDTETSTDTDTHTDTQTDSDTISEAISTDTERAPELPQPNYD